MKLISNNILILFCLANYTFGQGNYEWCGKPDPRLLKKEKEHAVRIKKNKIRSCKTYHYDLGQQPDTFLYFTAKFNANGDYVERKWFEKDSSIRQLNRFEYDEKGRLLVEYILRHDSDSRPGRKIKYDEFGNLLIFDKPIKYTSKGKIEAYLHDNGKPFLKFRYNAKGYHVERTEYYPSGQLIRKNVFVFDSMGNMTRNHAFEFRHYTSYSKTDTLKKIDTLIRFTDTLKYNAKGKLVFSNSDIGGLHRLKYYPDGRIKQMIEGDIVTNYFYDKHSNLVEEKVFWGKEHIRGLIYKYEH